MNKVTMSQEELLRLPVTVDLTVAGRALGLGRTLAYDLAKRGAFPVRLLRLGVKYRVSRADLLRYLGEDAKTSAGSAAGGGHAA
jgi:hypothetical protein